MGDKKPFSCRLEGGDFLAVPVHTAWTPYLQEDRDHP